MYFSVRFFPAQCPNASPHRAARDLAHYTIISALIRPEIIYSRSDRINHFLFDFVFVFSVVDPINRDNRIFDQAALCIDDDGRDGRAVIGHTSAVLDRLAMQWNQPIAVQGEAIRKDLIDDLRPTGRQSDHRAVQRHNRLGYLTFARQFRMRNHMPRFTMHRHRDLRIDPLIHLHKLITCRMS